MHRNPHATTVLVLAVTVALIGCAVLIGRSTWRSLISDPTAPSLRVSVPSALSTADGLRYRLVAKAQVFTGDQNRLAITADPGDSPVVAIRAACALTGSHGVSTMDLQVTGTPDFYSGDPSFRCPMDAASLREFPVAMLPHSGTEVSLDLSERPHTTGPSPAVPAAWLFAVYVRVSQRPSTVPVAPAMPPTLYADTLALTRVDRFGGVWPDDRRLRITLPKGHHYTLAIACSEVMAGRSTITMSGKDDASPCPDESQPPYRDEADATGKDVTLTVTFSVADADIGHAGSWTVAVYQSDG